MALRTSISADAAVVLLRCIWLWFTGSLLLNLYTSYEVSGIGNEILDRPIDWKLYTNKKIALRFVTTHDYNHAFDTRLPTVLMAQVASEKKQHYLELRVDSVSQMRDILKHLKKQGNAIPILMLSFHGSPVAMEISSSELISPVFSQTSEKVKEIFEMLDEGCQVYLDSCSTGAYPEKFETVVEYLAKLNPNVQVIAPLRNITGILLNHQLGKSKHIDFKFRDSSCINFSVLACLMEMIGATPIASVFEQGRFKKYV